MKTGRLGAALAAAPSGALLAALAWGCAQPVATILPDPVAPRPCPAAAEVSESVFLVGGAGRLVLPKHPEAELPVDRVLRNLREEVMEQAGALGVSRVAVIYLGNNVHPRGLPPVGQQGRSRGERLLRQQITAAGPAQVIFAAGEQDWDLEGPFAWEHVRAQQGFLSLRGERVALLPPGGCAGPARFDFGRHLRFVFVDAIGIARALERPERHAEVCEPEAAADALLALARELDQPQGRHVVLAMHHPLITAGPAGGRSSEGAGVAGDVRSRSIAGIFRATRPRVPILVAAGHERNLQLHRDAVGAYYAVSGSGSASDVTGIEPVSGAMYAAAEPGYLRLDLHADGALSVSVVTVPGERRETALHHCLAEGPPA